MPSESRRRFLHRSATIAALGVIAGCQTRRDDRSATESATETTIETDATPTPTARPPIDGAWRSFQRDAGNTGATDASGPATDPTARWQYTASLGRPVVAPVATTDTVVFVPETGVVTARRLTDGRTRWRRQPAIDPTASPVIVGENDTATVIVADGDTLRAFAVATGDRQWSVTLSAELTGVAADAFGVVATTPDSVVTLDPTDGTRQWTRSLDLDTVPPATGDGVIAVSEPGRTVRALDPTDGSDLWRESVTDALIGGPTVADGTVVVGTGTTVGERTVATSAVVGLSAADGSRRWRAEAALPLIDSPAAGPGATSDTGTVVSVTFDTDATRPTEPGSTETRTPPPTDTEFGAATVTARDAATGDRRWQATRTVQYNFTSGPPTTAPTTVSQSLTAVVVGGELTVYRTRTGTALWDRFAPSVRPAVAAHGDGRVVTTGTTAFAADGSELWTTREAGTSLTQPVIDGNTVYVGSGDGTLYAVSGNDGQLQWAVPTGDRLDAAPAVADDRLYVGTADGRLIAFDTTRGEQLWRRAVTDTLRSPVVQNGTVYVGAFGSELFAFDAASGERRWATRVDRQAFVALDVAVGDEAVFGGANGDLRAFETSDGTERWRVVGDRRVQSPPAVADGRCYVNIGTAVRAFDTSDGTELWAQPTGGASRPPVVADGTVYAPGDGAVHAFDAATGDRQWRAPVGEDCRLVVADGVVYGDGFDVPTFALNATDGSNRWLATDAEIATPLAVADGLLFYGDTEGTLYAVEDA